MFLPIIILVSPYFLGIRLDFVFIVLLLFIFTILKLYDQEKITIQNISILFLILVVFGAISTLIYGVKKYDSSFSFGLCSYWIRILVISVLCNFASSYINLKDFEKSVYLFISISFLVISLGFFESFKVLPNIYQDIIKLYIPSTSLKNYEILSNLNIRRATSLLVHPSSYSLFVIYILLLIYCKRFKNNLYKNSILLILFICGLLSHSKIFYLFICACLLCFIYKCRYKISTYIYITCIISFIITLLNHYNIPKLFVVITELANKGFYEAVLRTRYDIETGQLRNSYTFIKENLFFGHGYMYNKKLFLGDSFIITNLQKFGLFGFSYLVILFLFLVKFTYDMRIPKKFDFTSSMLKANFYFLILLVPSSFGFNVLSIFKLSDILYYFIFMTLFLSKRYNYKFVKLRL